MTEYRLTSGERDAILRLFSAMAIIGSEPRHLERRLAEIEGADEDLKIVRDKIFRIMEELFKTVPIKQVNPLKRDIHNCTYQVKVIKSIATDDANEKDYMMNLSYDTIYTLLKGCHDRCLMCNLDKAQRKACKLKKALDEVPNNIPDCEDGDCPYFGIV